MVFFHQLSISGSIVPIKIPRIHMYGENFLVNVGMLPVRRKKSNIPVVEMLSLGVFRRSLSMPDIFFDSLIALVATISILGLQFFLKYRAALSGIKYVSSNLSAAQGDFIPVPCSVIQDTSIFPPSQYRRNHYPYQNSRKMYREIFSPIEIHERMNVGMPLVRRKKAKYP